MRTRGTLAGLLVLAFVAAGVFWARGVRVASPRLSEPPDFQSSSEPAALPDITLADATVDLGDLRLTLSVAPRPPVAFAQRFYRVRVEANGAAARLEHGEISFTMKMPMGDHRYSLVPGADGWHEAVIVLPMCASGDPRWFATVEGTVDGRPVTARFRVDMAK